MSSQVLQADWMIRGYSKSLICYQKKIIADFEQSKGVDLSGEVQHGVVLNFKLAPGGFTYNGFWENYAPPSSILLVCCRGQGKYTRVAS